MKLIFDQNISFKIVKLVEDIFPKSKQLRDLGIENYSDKQIWQFALQNKYTIVTFDSDFYNFSLVWGFPPKIILLRTFNQTTKNIEFLIRSHSESIKDFLKNEKYACLELS